MATQSTKGNDPQTQQSQPITRSEQQPPARRGFGLGPWSSPTDFFRMDPSSLMRRMSHEFDRMFDWGGGREQSSKMWSPAIEVKQRDNQLVVQAELPGLKPEDVKLEVVDGSLVIQGESRSEQEETKGGVHISERRYGSFYRAIPLPESAKVDQAQARFNNGVLEVTVPTEEQKSDRRQIPIQGATQSGTSGTTEKPKAA